MPEDFQENLRKRRRSHLAICAGMLKALSAESMSLSKTIVFMNLNSRLAKQCLDELLASGFVVTSKTKPVSYSATASGMNWLEQYRLLITELEYGPRNGKIVSQLF